MLIISNYIIIISIKLPNYLFIKINYIFVIDFKQILNNFE